MRTTLTIDDDVLAVARQIADATGRPIGEVVSELARRSIMAVTRGAQRNGITLLPVDGGSSGATLEDVNRLRDELP